MDDCQLNATQSLTVPSGTSASCIYYCCRPRGCIHGLASDVARLSEHSKASLVAGIGDIHALQCYGGDGQSDEHSRVCEGQDSMPLRRRSGVEYELGVEGDSTITDTCFVKSSCTGKPKVAFSSVLVTPISDYRPFWEHCFCETCELGYVKDMKEATCPRRRTAISCRGLDWAAMALLFCRKSNGRVGEWLVESHSRGIWLGERLPQLHGSVKSSRPWTSSNTTLELSVKYTYSCARYC